MEPKNSMVDMGKSSLFSLLCPVKPQSDFNILFPPSSVGPTCDVCLVEKRTLYDHFHNPPLS